MTLTYNQASKSFLMVKMLRKEIPKLKLTNFLKVIGSSELIDKELYILDGVLNSKLKSSTIDDCHVVDAENCILAPGFIDLQVNGLGKCNFWNSKPSYNEIDNLRIELAKSGVTGFCPTLITAPTKKITESIDYINSYIKDFKNSPGAKIKGIHIEGIFISKLGVHDKNYVQNELIQENVAPFIRDNVVLFTLAPELDKTGKAIKFLNENNITVSVGHSNATYLEGKNAIEKYGLRLVTHMFNALRGVEGFSHRGDSKSNLEVLKAKLNDESKIKPDDGIILSILKDKKVFCMVIPDGVHVNLETINFLFEIKGKAGVAIVSDIISDDFHNEAKLKNMLGGGQNTLDKCVQNLIKCNVLNTEDALLSASKSVIKGLNNTKCTNWGEMKTGMEANLVIWDTDKNAVKGTIIGQNLFLNY